MLNCVIIFAVIAAVNCDIVKEFVKQGRVVTVAVETDANLPKVDCTQWFDLSLTEETTSCDGMANVPIVNMALPASHRSMPAAVIAFENKEDMKTYNSKKSCDKTPIRLLITKSEEGFTLADFISNERSEFHRATMIFSTKVPTYTALENFSKTLGISGLKLNCYSEQLKTL